MEKREVLYGAGLSLSGERENSEGQHEEEEGQFLHKEGSRFDKPVARAPPFQRPVVQEKEGERQSEQHRFG